MGQSAMLKMRRILIGLTVAALSASVPQRPKKQ